jgi:hypothetical protein
MPVEGKTAMESPEVRFPPLSRGLRARHGNKGQRWEPGRPKENAEEQQTRGVPPLKLLKFGEEKTSREKRGISRDALGVGSTHST